MPSITDSTSTEPLRMLILETDEPHPETYQRKGSMGDILRDLFKRAGNTHDPPLSVDVDMRFIIDDPSNNNHGRVPKLSEISKDIHAILITGSVYDAHGSDTWVLQLLALLKDIWTQRPDIMLSGICFGHQIIARLLGARVEPHPEELWELSHTELALTDVGQKLFKVDRVHLHQMHQDSVTSVPSSATSDLLQGCKVHNWAETDHTRVQGLYIKDRVFSTQGHLGFDERMVHRQIEMRSESISEEHEAEAKEEADLDHDGLVVAQAILRFFHGDDHHID